MHWQPQPPFTITPSRKVRSTKPRLPVELVYYEIYPTAVEARKRELGLKNGRTRSKTIQWLIRTFPKKKLLPFERVSEKDKKPNHHPFTLANWRSQFFSTDKVGVA